MLKVLRKLQVIKILIVFGCVQKEGKEKEDVNEKDKISQSYDSKASALTDANNLRYPDNFTHNVSVYLEQNTPPPEYS